jgi:aerobic-type carbon monoxide dehydrogenase small subunit (CoxS/CutS family)
VVEDRSVVGELEFRVDGRDVRVVDDGSTLLEVLRDRLGIRGPKDGCSPQGQCGCCTVLVDGAARVACVTPARRVAGRSVTTVDGIEPDARVAWSEAFCATGASQCGFCTPGIICRFEGLRARDTGADDLGAVEQALQAHLCRCTGWRSILDAWAVAVGGGGGGGTAPGSAAPRDLAAASRRATIEGGAPQVVGPEVALGAGRFADDTAPAEALVAVRRPDGEWVVAENAREARRLAGKVQGRRTTVEAFPPLRVPDGEWARTLRTSWVEPAYLETDASWCEPGGEPASPLANGGAFGGKVDSPVAAVARRLADQHGRAVRVLLSREDTVRLGPKRPPVAVGMRPDGSGELVAVRTPGLATLVAAVAPTMRLTEVDVVGPPTSLALRGAGWAELAVVASSLDPSAGVDRVQAPDGGWAEASVTADGHLEVLVGCGLPLDEVVVRSFALGAAHMALGWVTSEALSVGDDGEPRHLTVRSFGVPRAVDTPPIEVVVAAEDGPPVNGSDAVFAAVAAAVWRAQGFGPEWPSGRPLR